METRFEELKHNYTELTGKLKALKEIHKGNKDYIATLTEEYEDANELRVLAQEVAEQTMNNLSFHVSNIVTSALAAVWDDPFEFDLEFVQVRNAIECNLWFVKDGNRIKPIDSSGGGALDVASFALRLTYWSLRPNRPTFLLDEPFKYVSEDLQGKCSEMVKMLADRLGLQIIMVSHLPNINISADTIYNVRLRGDVSTVRKVK